MKTPQLTTEDAVLIPQIKREIIVRK